MRLPETHDLTFPTGPGNAHRTVASYNSNQLKHMFSVATALLSNLVTAGICTGTSPSGLAGIDEAVAPMRISDLGCEFRSYSWTPMPRRKRDYFAYKLETARISSEVRRRMVATNKKTVAHYRHEAGRGRTHNQHSNNREAD